jgi:Abnormal spindle-like microcephaly-assoc'd, ASPM-SPD-2-Hydin
MNTASGAITVVVTNNSRETTAIQQVTSSLPEFVVITGAMPITISPRSSTSFQVMFKPDAALTFNGSIVVIPSHKAGGPISIGVSGTGTPSGSSPTQTYLLSTSATSLNFGNALLGASASQAVTVTNAGTGSVNISQVASSGAGFSVSGFSGGVTLAAGQSLALTASFAPTAVGAVNGSISVVSTATNSPATISLSGTGIQPQISVTPSSLSFGSINVATTASQTVTIRNPGTASLNVTQASLVGAGFASSGLTLPLSIPPGGSSAFNVGFTPASAANFSGSITLISNAPNSSLVIPLSGTGSATTLQLSVSPSSLSFGNLATGSSTAQTVTISNTGNSSVSISQITESGAGFSNAALGLPLSLAAGQSTSFLVAFAPTTTGSFAGSITVVSNAANSPATISMSGTGVQPQISATPSSVSFGNISVAATGTQTITIRNPGTTTLTVTQASLVGTGFTSAGLTLPLTVPPGGSSSFNVGFTPASASTFSGSITLVSNAPNSSLVIPLAGTGISTNLQLSVSPASLSFGSLTTGTSAVQTVTISNTGNSSVAISQITESGAGFSNAALGLPLSLAAGQSTAFLVAFAPTTTGSFAGSITVVSNAANSPATISMSGTGVQPQISVIPSSVTFGNVSVGVNNTQTITIRNPSTAAVSVTQASLAGTGFTSSGLVLPLSIAPGGSSSFTVGFTPASATNYSGSVTLISNAPNSPMVVPLAGTGISTNLQLSVSPASLSFGSVTTGTSATQTVTISNTGNSSVAISQITESGAGFTNAGIGLPLSLAAGQSTSFLVGFSPATTGSLAGSITVVSNAANSPLMIALSGTGTTAASYSVSLNWTPSSSTYSGFNVYRGTTSGGPYSKVDASVIATPSYTDSAVTQGQTYYYVATELDSTGMESGYSSQVSATIP